jgi:hypothetical protein
MRGPKSAYPIALTAEEAQRIECLIRAHSTPQAVAVRARIILTAHQHPKQGNQQITSNVGTTDRTVRSGRRCWVKTQLLADAPRSGAPRRFSPSGTHAGDRRRV